MLDFGDWCVCIMVGGLYVYLACVCYYVLCFLYGCCDFIVVETVFVMLV